MDEREFEILNMKRQKVFSAYGPDSAQFRYFRKLVNRERKACRGKYDELKIQHLRRKSEKVGDEMKTPKWPKDFPQ